MPGALGDFVDLTQQLRRNGQADLPLVALFVDIRTRRRRCASVGRALEEGIDGGRGCLWFTLDCHLEDPRQDVLSIGNSNPLPRSQRHVKDRFRRVEGFVDPRAGIFVARLMGGR